MNPTKMNDRMFLYFLLTLLSNYMKSLKQEDASKNRSWFLEPRDMVEGSFSKSKKKNEFKYRKMSFKQQIKQLDKLAKPVIVFVMDHPEEELKHAFVVFNEAAFDPKFILNDVQLMLDIFGNGIYSTDDFAIAKVLKKLCEDLRRGQLKIDSYGNVILTDVLEELKKCGLVTIVRSVYTFKQVSHSSVRNPEGMVYKPYNEYIIRYEILN